MSNILVSGLVNIETTVKVHQFPIAYFPIDYPFFGVNTAVSGVAYNIARALKTLDDSVNLFSMTGDDFPAAFIRDELRAAGIGTERILPKLRQTPNSAVLYDDNGNRQIYCDLKDIQETPYPFDGQICDSVDLVIACNTNFNRPLLSTAKAAGKPIATDVHVLAQVDDPYNRDFMEAADILFLSDECLGENYCSFLLQLAHTYGNEIIVLGRGGKGAAMYLHKTGQMIELPAVRVGEIVNTVGAGDALFSAFVHYYVKGFSPLDALIRAELFASSKIRVNGASRGFIGEEAIEQSCIYFENELRRNVQYR